MKKTISLVLALLMVTFVFAGCSKPAAEPAAEPAATEAEAAAPVDDGTVYTIKAAHVESAEHNENKLFEKFKELIEERSGGRIVVEIYPAAQLGDENALVESCQMNAVQMTCPSAAGAARFYDPLNIFMMPFYLNGENEIDMYHNLMGAIDSVWDDLNAGIIAKSGLRLTAPFWYGGRTVTNNVRPIEKASDLVGINMRVPDQELYTQVFKALGATVTPIAFGELYMALSQGVVDGQDNPPNSTFDKKFYEVQKYITLTGHITQIQLPLMCDAFYQSLPEDLQTMVIDCMQEAAVYASELQAQANIDMVDTLVEKGMQLSVADRDTFVEATKDIPSIMLDEEGMGYYNTLMAALEEVYNNK